jgi:antitoxin (DNA-binding transcriptional repressor) of toxin-antitoxin stability system
MAAESKYVNLEDKPDLVAVARDVEKSGESVVLREAGHQVAVISPLAPSEKSNLTALERRERIMAHAGSLKGLIDEDVIEEIYRGRTISSRPPVDL